MNATLEQRIAEAHKIDGKILDTTLVAKIVREQLKQEFPACKFSVTCKYFSGGSELSIALMAAPFEVFAAEQTANSYPQDKGYAQLNHYQLWSYDYDYHKSTSNGYILTREAWDVLRRAVQVGNAQNWDHSDIQSDYFDVNYYFHIDIGKWDKPFQVTH